MPREWTIRDVIEYADDRNFNAAEKDAILKAATKYTILEEFLDTTVGRVVLDGVVDQIRNLTIQIVTLSTEGAEKHVQDIIQAALLIKMSMNFMRNLATTAKQGADIINEAKTGV